MKVLLVKDVNKLGRAGDVKSVADSFARNFLIPQGMAVLATPGALKKVEEIREQARVKREELNKKYKQIAEQIDGTSLVFRVKAGENGRLYGPITTRDMAAALNQKTELDIDRLQIDMLPIRRLGKHTARIRLTMDLIPKINIIVRREGELTETFDDGIEYSQLAPVLEIAGRLPGGGSTDFPDDDDEDSEPAEPA